jgi:pimeloyl-ACP methyl ester carboxylesterase
VQPDIRYARSGGVAIAYQVVGDGDTDLVYVPDYLSNLVYGWESPRWRSFYDRLAQSFRLILFDKRGTGLSDYGGQFPSLETRMDDVRAVLDAVGSTSTVLLGSQDGCSMALLFAATYPERTRALALFHPVTEYSDSDRAEALTQLVRLREEWGTQEFCDLILSWNAPSLLDSEHERLWFANWLRVGASPAVAYAMNRAWVETDLGEVLPAVRVPTLVLYRECGWRELLDRHHALVRRELLRFRGEEKDTAGDGFFATFDGPARAIRCARSVVDGVRELGLDVRAGVHTGECEVHDAKVAGIAVSIGARVAAEAGAGEVLVSQTVKDLVAGSGLEFGERGEHELKGVPGAWRLYSVVT